MSCPGCAGVPEGGAQPAGLGPALAEQSLVHAAPGGTGDPQRVQHPALLKLLALPCPAGGLQHCRVAWTVASGSCAACAAPVTRNASPLELACHSRAGAAARRPVTCAAAAGAAQQAGRRHLPAQLPPCAGVEPGVPDAGHGSHRAGAHLASRRARVARPLGACLPSLQQWPQRPLRSAQPGVQDANSAALDPAPSMCEPLPKRKQASWAAGW